MLEFTNKLKGGVKRQRCPTHIRVQFQHVTGCSWQHLGSTGLEPQLIPTAQSKQCAQQQLQQSDNIAASQLFTLSISIYISIYRKKTYVYIYIYTQIYLYTYIYIFIYLQFKSNLMYIMACLTPHPYPPSLVSYLFLVFPHLPGEGC